MTEERIKWRYRGGGDKKSTSTWFGRVKGTPAIRRTGGRDGSPTDGTVNIIL